MVKVTQSHLTLWDPMDYIVHGILQARILEWVVVPFSRGSNPGLLHCKWILYQLSHQRSPENGTDELICKVEIETHVENKYMDTKSGRKGWVNWEIGINIYTLICIKYIPCCNEYWGTCVSFNSGFLSVCAQQWDCWVIWQFYLQFFKESPHCSP